MAGNLNSDPEIGKKLSAYQVFVRAKENAGGLERAMSMPIFVVNKVTPTQLRIILEKIDAQDSYFKIFNSYASDQEKSSLMGILDSDASKEVVRLRKVMYDQSATDDFNVDSMHWFKTISTKIDALYDLEKSLTQEIALAASEQTKDQQTVVKRSHKTEGDQNRDYDVGIDLALLRKSDLGRVFPFPDVFMLWPR